MTIILGITAWTVLIALPLGVIIGRGIDIADEAMWDGSCPDTVPEWVQA